MPAVARPTVEGGPIRDTRRHLWLGSLIPKEALTAGEEAYYALFRAGVDIEVRLERTQPVVVLTNARADHAIPTGDPERFLLVRLELIGSDGQVLGEATERLGQVWEWYPVARKLSDNRLAWGEVRELRPNLVVPRGAKVRWWLEHHRISEANAAHHSLDGYPRMRVVAEGEVQR